MRKKVRIQQFHESAKAARSFGEHSLLDSRSSMSMDYPGMTVSSVRRSRGKNVPAPINGRSLFDITLKRRR